MAKKQVRKNKNMLSKRKAIFIAIGVLLLLGLLYFTVIRSDTSTKQVGVTSDGKKVNLSPPTQADKDASDAQKAEILQKEQQAQADTPLPTTKATAIITQVSKTSLRGYISGVFEDGGTCIATATQGSQTVTQSSMAYLSVSDTQCVPINWVLGEGTWIVTLKYSSVTASAQSSPIEVK